MSPTCVRHSRDEMTRRERSRGVAGDDVDASVRVFVEAEEDTLDCASEKKLEEGVLDVVGVDLEGDLSGLEGEVLDASKGAVLVQLRR